MQELRAWYNLFCLAFWAVVIYFGAQWVAAQTDGAFGANYTQLSGIFILFVVYVFMGA